MTDRVVVFMNQSATERLRAWEKEDGWSLERQSRETHEHPWGRGTCSSIRGSREALVRHADAIGLDEVVPQVSFSDPGDGYDSAIRHHADLERGDL